MARAPVKRKSPSPKTDTVRLCGHAAVEALFKRSPDRAERLFFDDRHKQAAGHLCARMAAQHKPYRLVPTAELDKIAGTPLHGGMVLLARPRAPVLFDPLEAAGWAKRGEPLVILDGVSNPHNLGAIARTLAFYGFERVMVSGHPSQALPSDAAHRVSEGGLEWLDVVLAPKFIPALKRLKDSYRLVGTALGGGQVLDRVLAPSPKPVAVILGNEEHGLHKETLALCDAVATITGSGRVQSLNVAATAAILIHQLAKSHSQD